MYGDSGGSGGGGHEFCIRKSMELPREIDQNRVKPLDEECNPHQHQKDKRLQKGCTNLMYACQQGHTQIIVQELRTKVCIPDI